jgi:hypothetical protein
MSRSLYAVFEVSTRSPVFVAAADSIADAIDFANRVRKQHGENARFEVVGGRRTFIPAPSGE